MNPRIAPPIMMKQQGLHILDDPLSLENMSSAKNIIHFIHISEVSKTFGFFCIETRFYSRVNIK